MTTKAKSIEDLNWRQDVSFVGADGRDVRCYDDVALARPLAVEGGVGTDVSEVPAGTIATVLFVIGDDKELAQLECYVGETAFTFGYEETRFLALHMTNEEKYPR
jgi:hypothetical protein